MHQRRVDPVGPHVTRRTTAGLLVHCHLKVIANPTLGLHVSRKRQTRREPTPARRKLERRRPGTRSLTRPFSFRTLALRALPSALSNGAGYTFLLRRRRPVRAGTHSRRCSRRGAIGTPSPSSRAAQCSAQGTARRWLSVVNAAPRRVSRSRRRPARGNALPRPALVPPAMQAVEAGDDAAPRSPAPAAAAARFLQVDPAVVRLIVDLGSVIRDGRCAHDAPSRPQGGFPSGRPERAPQPSLAAGRCLDTIRSASL